MNLQSLAPGESGFVEKIDMKGGMRRRLMDLGLIEGTRVECVGAAPSGEPKAFFIRGAVIAIRKEDCEKIIISGRTVGY